MRAPKPSKLGFPSAFGLRPLSSTHAAELYKKTAFWIGLSQFQHALPVSLGFNELPTRADRRAT